MTFYQLKPWEQSRALIVNDDGIDARGIKELESLARGIFAEVVVVAPVVEQSGMGAAVSHNKKIKMHRRDATHYSVEGTPADCTILGLNLVMKDNPPDIVLSGLNHGGNLGNCIPHSGTFSGALAAGFAGVPAIALSQHYNFQQKDKIDFTPSRKHFTQVMNFLQTAEWPDHVVMNVNFPSQDKHENHRPQCTPLKNMKVIKGVDSHPMEDGSCNYSIVFDLGDHDGGFHDIEVLFNGGVTITPISTNWTCHETLKLWTK